jgi:ribonuclease-3 family protein
MTEKFTDKQKKEFKQLNGLALAYMGDAVYEVAVRRYLIAEGDTKPNQLHQKATRFVSAKAQFWLMEEMESEGILSDEEIAVFKRGRNAKSHTKAKNADVRTYRTSSGFEALIGYIYLAEDTERLNEIINWCIEKIVERES